jgi:flavin-dependent dehydrogenase
MRPRGPRKASLSFRVLGRRAEALRGTLFLGGTTTLGIAPVSAAGHEWNVTLVSGEGPGGGIVDSHRLASDPRGLLEEWMATAGIEWSEGPRISEGPWASGSFHRRNRSVAGRGVILVGDAAGYYDPLTGQGISRAIRGAALAADAVDRALLTDRTNSEFPGYPVALERMIRPTRAVQKAVEFVVSRPRVRDAALGALGRAPSLAGLLVRTTGDTTRPRGLL